jgi:uncharacterized protein YdaU (DUF1376 family)
MSSAPISIHFHIGDYLRDTEGLTGSQHGFYLLLMCWYYSTGRPLPNDLQRIYRRVHAESLDEKQAVEYVLAQFFRLEGNAWMHKRIEDELSKWREKTAQAQASANRRWENAKQNNDNADANALETHSVRNASRIPYPVSRKDQHPCASYDARFLEFWSQYPRKKSKGQAWKAWQRLRPNADLGQQIADGLNRAKSSKDWKRDNGKFIPHPATWLNARGWEDETAAEESRMGKFVV